MITVRNWLLPVLMVVSCAILNSCEDPDNIGIEVQPSGIQPGVFFTDTFSIEATIIREDTLRSDEGIAGLNLLGSYTDPVFGRSTASIYSQLRLPNNNTNFSFGTDPQLDSVVLTLSYVDFYGDTVTPLTMDVYQMNEMLYLDSNYYTNRTMLLGNQIGNAVVEVHPKDSVEVNGVNTAPHMRIKLDDAFGTAFITSGDANFLTNASFISYFNGIYVKAQDVNSTGQGSILTFNLQALMSKLSFYYRNGTDTTRRQANFEINSDCPRFTHYDHDYTTSVFGDNFPLSGENKLYVQSMAGLKVRFKFPHIMNLVSNGLVSINKAELVIPVEDNSTFTSHLALLVFGVDSVGGEAVIPDLLESASYYGGTYDSDDQTYSINLARYVQRLISGQITTDYGLSIIAGSGAQSAYRSIIPGTSATGTRMKLNVTYSKLN